ncbi:MAG: hypothetical protein HLX51_09050 [Micrococcaceae bacterium]|nr:hypothetical protein [Micrococcaceae bacterium]
MSANVTGGPTHWRANLDELKLGVGHLQEATEQTMNLAGKAVVAGGLLSGVTIMTPQGPLIGTNTVALSTGLVTMRGEVELLSTGVDAAIAAYLETEQRVTTMVNAAATPAAIVLSIVGFTTDLNVPNDVYEIAVRGTVEGVWAGVEAGFTTLDRIIPGSKYVGGNVISWTMDLDENMWNIPPAERTLGMLAHSVGQFGMLNLAPYNTTNVTRQPGEDGWQDRDVLSDGGSIKAMQLLKDYAYEEDGVTVAKIQQDDGSDAYVVLYAGTTPLGEEHEGPLGLLQDDAAFGATGVVESIVADSAHVEDATMEILDQAGVPAGATVMTMGYSQGGTHALNVAMSDKMKAKYKVSDVLTVAAPTGHRRTEDFATNFVHIDHEHDKVPALTGASNEGRLNRTTIEVKGYPDQDVDAGVFGPEHNIGLIDHQLGEALNDPQVQHATNIPLQNIETKMGGPVAIQQFKLDRQQATPPQHPMRSDHSERAAPERPAPRKIIPVRPLPDWTTGTVRSVAD